MDGRPTQSSAQHAAAQRRPHLTVLTSLRFFAALHVVLFHLYAAGGWELPWALGNWFNTGYVAVSFFFVLSGFILTYTYAGESRRGTPLAEYYAARVARIYPVYLLGLLVCAPFWLKAHIGGQSLLRPVLEFFSVATLTQAFVPQIALAWNPPAWSLSVEAFFYLLFPFVMPKLFSISRRATWLVAACSWVFGLSLAWAYVWLKPDGIERTDGASVGFFIDFLKYNPLTRFPEFVVGIAVARQYLECGSGKRRSGFAMALGAGLGITLVLCVSSVVPYPVLHNGLLTPLFALVVYGLATAPTNSALRLLEARTLVVLGEASYALYILHSGVIRVVRNLIKPFAPGADFVHGPAFAVLAIGASIAAAYAAWRWVEGPMRARMRGLLTRKTATLSA